MKNMKYEVMNCGVEMVFMVTIDMVLSRLRTAI
jgi:hypothetical protein